MTVSGVRSSCPEKSVFCLELVPSGGPVPGFPCYLRGGTGRGRGRGPPGGCLGGGQPRADCGDVAGPAPASMTGRGFQNGFTARTGRVVRWPGAAVGGLNRRAALPGPRPRPRLFELRLLLAASAAAVAGGWVSRCPVLAVAHRAKSMAPLGVQLVKDVPRLVNGTGWPARGSRRPGQFTPGAVMLAGNDSGPRPALTGGHRDRRGPGAGRLRWPWPLGRGPERNRGHRQQDEGQRNVRRHRVLHGAPPRLSAAIAPVVPWFLGRCARH